MNNEEKILALLDSLVAKVDKLEQGQAEMKADMTEMKEVQNLHTRKLDAIAKSINLLTQHAITMSDRVMELEQKVYGL